MDSLLPFESYVHISDEKETEENMIVTLPSPLQTIQI